MKWFIWILVLVIGGLIDYLIRGSGWEYCWGVLIGGVGLIVLDYFDNK